MIFLGKGESLFTIIISHSKGIDGSKFESASSLLKLTITIDTFEQSSTSKLKINME